MKLRFPSLSDLRFYLPAIGLAFQWIWQEIRLARQHAAELSEEERREFFAEIRKQNREAAVELRPRFDHALARIRARREAARKVDA